MPTPPSSNLLEPLVVVVRFLGASVLCRKRKKAANTLSSFGAWRCPPEVPVRLRVLRGLSLSPRVFVLGTVRVSRDFGRLDRRGKKKDKQAPTQMPTSPTVHRHAAVARRKEKERKKRQRGPPPPQGTVGAKDIGPRPRALPKMGDGKMPTMMCPPGANVDKKCRSFFWLSLRERKGVIFLMCARVLRTGSLPRTVPIKREAVNRL